MLKKIDYFLLCLLIIMNIFSLIGLFNYDKILLYKQIIWILIGIVIILFITVIDNNIIFEFEQEYLNKSVLNDNITKIMIIPETHISHSNGQTSIFCNKVTSIS